MPSSRGLFEKCAPERDEDTAGRGNYSLRPGRYTKMYSESAMPGNTFDAWQATTGHAADRPIAAPFFNHLPPPESVMNSISTRVLAVVASVMLFVVAGLTTAHAQNPNCCDYIINTSLVPPNCFPIVVNTTWSGGQSDIVVINAPGYLARHYPFPCPPAPVVSTVTITNATLCVLTRATSYCDGCLFIDIV